jgi:hypothetical protein
VHCISILQDYTDRTGNAIQYGCMHGFRKEIDKQTPRKVLLVYLEKELVQLS